MTPSPPVDEDDAATEPIADLPLFSEAEVAAKVEPTAAKARSEKEPTKERKKEERESKTARPAAPKKADSIEDTATRPVLPLEEPESVPARASDATGEAGSAAPVVKRIQAALLDAVALGAVLVALVAGGMLLGAPSDLSALPFYMPAWLIFAFLYHVVPLLFWGSTPGMGYSGLVARSNDGGPLVATQAITRWLLTMATVLLAGIPGLAALRGRSLVDRLSRSQTLVGS